MATALIVDQDPHTSGVVRAALTERGYGVVVAGDAATALRLTCRLSPQVVVLDHGLPDMPGSDVIVALREMTVAPIVVVSARADREEIVRVLDAGADDYITKPFGVDEVLARVRAALRRCEATTHGRHVVVDTGSFTVDLVARKVWRDGAEVHLTPTEWSVLDVLVRHEGELVSHRQLLKSVWGPDHYADTQYLRVYMGQLRRKLEPHPSRPRHLITEPNTGYRFHARRADRSAAT
jgi:two-component system, OmpR family, KDP operon response regulator KdpE